MAMGGRAASNGERRGARLVRGGNILGDLGGGEVSNNIPEYVNVKQEFSYRKYCQQLVINHTLLIPPNTEHCLPSIAICPCSRCRWFAWNYQRYFTLWILEIYPIFITSHTIRWRNVFLLYLASSISQVVFRFSCFLSFSSCGTHFTIFWIFPLAFKRIETASRVTFNWSSSDNTCKSVFKIVRGGLSRFSYLPSKSPLLNFLNHSKHCGLPRACSPYSSTSIRCDSAAVFFKW